MNGPTDGGSTVDLAERALRRFSADLTREQAAAVLPLWRYYHDLTAAERAEVLSRFPRGKSIQESGSGAGG